MNAIYLQTEAKYEWQQHSRSLTYSAQFSACTLSSSGPTRQVCSMKGNTSEIQ